jgi:transmembrane sensor
MIGHLIGHNRPRTAAEWFAARRERSNGKLEKQFQAWVTEHTSHAEEYALCEVLWEVSRAAAGEQPMPMPSGRRAFGMRRISVALATAAAAASLLVWFWPPPTQNWATTPGEQRALLLEDGSRVTLNTRTRLSVTFAHHAREVVLDQGEAYFEVAKDTTRPFTVRTAMGSARAVGTHFNVYLDGQNLAVTTEEGSVLVAGPAAGGTVLVTTGRRAELHGDMHRPIVGPADLPRTLNWLAQRIEADNVPLATVLNEFNRYTTVPVRAASSAIAAVHVTAVLRIGDIDALRATLKGAFGFELEQRGGEAVVIDPQSGHAP